MPDHGFQVDVLGDALVVTAPEEIDFANAATFRSTLLEAIASGSGPLVVDLTRTRFCDTSGPHALMAAHRCAEAEGRPVLMVITSAIVKRMFALTGVDRLIPTFTSLSEALPRPVALESHGR